MLLLKTAALLAIALFIASLALAVRLIPLTQVRLYVVGSAVPHPCGDCPVL
jgi:hypothetical protein